MEEKIKNTAESKRDIRSMGFFDLAKGLGMLFIVFGHTYSTMLTPVGQSGGLFSGFFDVLGAAVVAMFFMISGYSFFKKKPKKCFVQQAKLLLKPYAITGALVILSKIVLALVKRRSFLEHGAVFIPTFLLGVDLKPGDSVFGIAVESIGILWFVLALFEVWVTYNLIVRIKSERMQNIIIGICVLVGYVLCNLPFHLPFMIPQSLIALGYFCVGHRIRQYKLLERELPLWALILTGSVASFCLLLGKVSIAHGIWKLGLIDVAGSFALAFLLLFGYVKWMERLKDNFLTKAISTIGFASIWIVCIHGFENCVFPWYRVRAFFPDKPAIAFFVVLILRSILIWCIYKVIMLIKRKKRRKKKVILE